MQRTVQTILVLSLASWAGGCGSSGVPTLPAPPLQTGSTELPAAAASGQAAPVESATVVPGTPTDVYALVARGALGCWFAPNGPLKTTHVFHADARPPAQGGTAEIVVHERDATIRDQRGPRALRVLFEAAPGGVRVLTTNVRIASPLGRTRGARCRGMGEGRCLVSGACRSVAAGVRPEHISQRHINRSSAPMRREDRRDVPA